MSQDGKLLSFRISLLGIFDNEVSNSSNKQKDLRSTFIRNSTS